MPCIGCSSLNNNGSGSSLNQSASFNSNDDSFIGASSEPTLKGISLPITFTKNQAQSKELKPGFYEITGRIEGEQASRERLENVTVNVPIDGVEYPVEVLEFETSENYENEGFQGVDYRAIVDVNSTPVNAAVPVVPIIWGVSAVGSFIAGSVFVDRVNKFVTSGAGFVVSLASLAILGYSVFYKK